MRDCSGQSAKHGQRPEAGAERAANMGCRGGGAADHRGKGGRKYGASRWGNGTSRGCGWGWGQLSFVAELSVLPAPAGLPSWPPGNTAKWFRKI